MYSWSLQLTGPLTSVPAGTTTELGMKYKIDHELQNVRLHNSTCPTYCLVLCLDSRIHSAIGVQFRSHFK